MQRTILSASVWLIVATVLLTVVFATNAFATGKEKTLYAFQGGNDGRYPQTSLIADDSGNLYGTTHQGGVSDYGTAFELKSQPDGTWAESVLYQFGNLDASTPNGGLVIDSSGNLYGSTQGAPLNGLFGVVFELTPSQNGWTETTLHTFLGNGDGYGPNSSLVIDNKGNLYGTTGFGGTGNFGVVFELKKSKGSWTETVLHSFSGGRDGSSPEGLVTDASGNLYGVTLGGGAVNRGILYELQFSNGRWRKLTLHSFTGGRDGSEPSGSLVFDKKGNIYGSTSSGGGGGCPYGCGIVFRLAFNSQGKWRETVLHVFKNNGHDGNLPLLWFHNGHNLYGVTVAGGRFGVGTIFELLPAFDGSWVERVLYHFSGGRDGSVPYGLMLNSGKLFGTVTQGGENFFGGVFEITP